MSITINCMIGKINDDYTITAVYCNTDGSPQLAGKILQEYYSDENQLDQLLSLGNISILGPIPEDDPKLWDCSYDYMIKSDKCRTYKGKGDTGDDAAIYSSGREYLYISDSIFRVDYLYMYSNGEWYYREHTLPNQIINLRTGEVEIEMFKSDKANN